MTNADGSTEEVQTISRSEAAQIVRAALGRNDIFHWRPGTIKGGDSGIRFNQYSKIRTRRDYENMLKTRIQGITKDVVTKEDLINDVQRSVLTFSRREVHPLEDLETLDNQILYVDDKMNNVTHRVYVKKPQFSNVSQDDMFKLWESKNGCKISPTQMALLSTATFIVEKDNGPGFPPTIVPKSLREALASDEWR